MDKDIEKIFGKIHEWAHLTSHEQGIVKREKEKIYGVTTLQDIIDRSSYFRSDCCEGNSDTVRAYLLLEWREYLKRPAYVDESGCINALIKGGDFFSAIATYCN